MEDKTAPTWFYGMIGVAAISAISFLLLATIMISTPRDQLKLTHLEPLPQETQAQ